MAYRQLKDDREFRKKVRPGFLDFAIAAIVLTVLGCIAFVGFAVLIVRFNPIAYSSPFKEAWDLITIFLLEHLINSIVYATMGLYFMASVVKFARAS